MTFRHTFQTAITGLGANKSRSALTILGIVVGITAIMLVIAVGQGAQELILGEIEVGSRTIAVIPGRQPSGPSDVAQIFSDSLTQRDLELLSRSENVPGAAEIMPVVFGGETASYGSETLRVTVFGASELISRIFDLVPDKGAFFADEDVRARADVAVIGAKVRDELFGLSDAMGERIRIKNRNFRVVGALPKKGQVSLFNFDDMVIVPHTTAQQYIFGIKHFHRFIIDAVSEEAVPQTVRDIEITLRNSHGITDPAKDDFFISTQDDAIATISTVTDVLTLLLVSVAAIALVVGGIGIMNIMLVSVNERTQEIGLRKALGATGSDILRQFLFEAIILTAVGGVIGILLGTGLAYLLSVVVERFLGVGWGFIFPLNGALLGLGISAAVGLVFGIYPASQASKKEPIEALRYE